MEIAGAGSYVPNNLADPTLELDRLRRQAEMFRQVETDVLTKSGLRKNHRILELGCGPGFVSKLLAELAADGELVSVDNNPQLLALYDKEVTRPPKLGARAVEGSVHAIPVADNWSDFVYARFLFQHVPSPEIGVKEAFRSTAPGGRCCIVDSDDGLVLHHPPVPEIGQLLNVAQTAQASYGGDRFIGRKLAQMMGEAGFIHVRSSIISMTSTEIPLAALFGILFGFKSALAGQAAEVRSLYERISVDAARGQFLLAGGIFVVVGEKPPA